ncbi:unnamed protein product [Ectocarpus sp. CCAP 1310/34]|nr:unnamed protein product [Ectocarpus sp. CCAP 1310/34]
MDSNESVYETERTIGEIRVIVNCCYDELLLLDPFPLITEEVITKLVGEKHEYHLAASDVDTD